MKYPSMVLALSSLLFSVVCLPARADTNQWVALFNGEDLTGWSVKGGKATYQVEDGCIVGTTAPKSANTFLCTDKHYSDFVLEFEFKCDPDLNSGVQIRSHSKNDYKNGRVHGYQVEIDPSEKRKRWWTAGIYEEAARGWLYPKQGTPEAKAFTEQGERIFKKQQWNHIRVEARGDHIRTWLNGELRADLHDDRTPSGFIGLQVHGVGGRTDPLHVRWRNLRLQEL